MPQGSSTAPLGTFDLNVGTIIDIENIIVQLDPADVPWLGMNGDDGRFSLPRGNCFEVKVEWLDDTLLSPRCTLGSSASGTHDATNGDAIGSSDTKIYLAAVDANRFSVNSVLLCESEYFLVTSVDTTGQQLTVARTSSAFGGSAAAHASGVDLIGIGMAAPEGSQPGASRAVDRSDRFNYTQIFGPEPVSVSGTEMFVRKYGLNGTTEFAYQAGQRAKEMYIGFEQALYYGIKSSALNVSRTRTMGGFLSYVTSNVDSSTTSLTETALLNTAQKSWANGGNAKNLLMPYKQKRVMSSFSTDLNSNALLRRLATDRERGEVVDRYVSDFGVLEAKMSRWLRTADVFGYDRDQLEVTCLRPMQFEILAKLGDSIQGQLVGEYTCKVRRQKHAYRFSALT